MFPDQCKAELSGAIETFGPNQVVTLLATEDDRARSAGECLGAFHPAAQRCRRGIARDCRARHAGIA